MGFFKKIGAFVKKNTKFISLQNAIKLGSSLDPTGMVGAINDKVQADKQAKRDAQAEEQQMALMQQQQANQNLQARSRSVVGSVLTPIGQGAVQGLNDSTLAIGGVAGSALVSSTIKQTFIKYKNYIIGAFLLLIGYFIWKKYSHKPKPSYRR